MPPADHPPPFPSPPGSPPDPWDVPATQDPFETLDPRVIPLFRLDLAIAALFLLAVTEGLLFGLSRALSWPPLATLAALALPWPLALAFVVLYPPRLYRSWSFRIRDRVIELQRGVFTQRSTQIPVSRIQHVDLRRGPLERRAGLATLALFTAGTQQAEQTIPGLPADRAAQLRDRFLCTEGDDAV